MQLKIQVGVEVWDNGRRKVRITPIDKVLPDMPDEIEGLLLLMAGAADAGDLQKGDGEVDIPIGTVKNAVNVPALAFASDLLNQFDGDANVFIRLKAA